MRDSNSSGCESRPFWHNLPGTFDIPPGGPKGPTLSGQYNKGSKHFNPFVNEENWKARIRAEESAATRFVHRTFSPTKIIRSTTPQQQQQPPVSLLPKFIRDVTVANSLRMVRRRVREIDAGSAVTPYPTVQAVNVQDRASISTRNLILGAAQSLLPKEDLHALDDFLVRKLALSKSPLITTDMWASTRPQSSASKTQALRPKTGASSYAASRPSTGMAGYRSETLSQGEQGIGIDSKRRAQTPDDVSRRQVGSHTHFEV